MAKFAAEGIVEPLEYTLQPYADVSGVIAEPTSQQVQAFITATQREVARFREEFGDLDEDTPQGILDALDKMDPERTEATLRRNADIYSALCSGKPSAEQLLLLPHRVMLAFAKWLSDEVLNPEAVTGGGNAQVVSLRSSAAG